jgi:sugar phosphate isomerase/epimerase
VYGVPKPLPKTIAAQLWTVRSLLGDGRGFVSTLQAIRRIGYRAVEIAGLGSIPPMVVRGVLDDLGITVCSAHERADELLEHPGRIAQKLQIYRCAYVVFPYPRRQDLSSIRSIINLCRALTRAGKAYREEGLCLSYHHHSLEFQKVGGHLPMDVILSETEPELLEIEPDTYWLQASGVDPAHWLHGLKRRAALLHLKDYGVGSGGVAQFREVGAGNLDWARILPAARRAGCRWYIVEQDDHWREGDPLASLAASWRFLSGEREEDRSR